LKLQVSISSIFLDNYLKFHRILFCRFFTFLPNGVVPNGLFGCWEYAKENGMELWLTKISRFVSVSDKGNWKCRQTGVKKILVMRFLYFIY
jgi:hypothetical protein